MPLFVCPYCRNQVEPMRDATGAMVCPMCRNTGQAAAPAWPQPPAQQWPPQQAWPHGGDGGHGAQHAGQGSYGAPGPGYPAPPQAYGAHDQGHAAWGGGWPQGTVPPWGAVPWAAPRQTSSKAVAALVLGIVALVPMVGLLTFIPAIVLGALAIRDVNQARGYLDGKGMAITGLVLGCVGILWGFVMVASILEESSYDSNGLDLPELEVTSSAGPGGTITVESAPSYPYYWDDWSNHGTAQCTFPYEGRVEEGQTIQCTTDGTVELYDDYEGEYVFFGEV